MNSGRKLLKPKKVFLALIGLGVVSILVVQYVLIESTTENVETNAVKSFTSTGRYVQESRPRLSAKKEFYKVFKTSNATLRLLSAFYDARSFHVRRNQIEIKIIAMIDVVEPKVDTFCQLWFDGIDGAVVSHVHKYKYMFNESWSINRHGSNQYRLSCLNPLALLGNVPISVSVVERPGDIATNKLPINYNLPAGGMKKPLAICTKPDHFKDDITMIFIEWVEAWFALGIDKIYLNVMEVHPELLKLFEFYEAEGKLEVRWFPEPLESYWLVQNEMVALNDCFLRHMHEYEFLISVDVDEIIVPSSNQDKNLLEFLTRVIKKINIKKFERENHVFSGYMTSNFLYLLDNDHKDEIQPEVPANFHYLQKVYRSVRYPRGGVKSFQYTETTDIMHNHSPMFCLSDEGDLCKLPLIDYADAKLHHYRQTCEADSTKKFTAEMCRDFTNNTTRDDSLWKWKDDIILNVSRSVKRLKKFKESY